MVNNSLMVEIPSNDILNMLSHGFMGVADDFFDVEIEVQEEKDFEQETFAPPGSMVGQIDFVGSVAGFVAVSAEPTFLQQIFDLPSEDVEELVNPLKEVLNTVAGKCLKILVDQYAVVTMLAPKVTVGSLFYPKVKCYTKEIMTPYGKVNFHFSIDQMKLDVSRLVDKLSDAEEKSRKVVDHL